VSTVIKLHEHEFAEVAVTSEQAIALQHTGILDVAPAWSPGRYRLKAGAIIGSVMIDDELNLRIIPKLEIRRVVYLLCHAVRLATWDDRLVDLDDEATIDVAVAEAFTTAAERALRRGPRSSYFTKEEDLMEVRGRIDANQQRLRYGLLLPISVSYDDYGPDISENQLILGAVLQLQRLPTLSGTLRRRLRRLGASLEGVRPFRRDEATSPVLFNRLNERYRPAVALARTVLQGLSFDLGLGSRSVTGFTFNMNKLFEDFLTVSLTEALEDHDGHLYAQRQDHLDRDRQARIIPDLTWVRRGKPSAVIDAKYKDPSDGSAADADLYQVVAYCAGLGVRRAILVHATDAASARLIIASGTIEVTITGLDLAAPLPSLRAQIAALADLIDPSMQRSEGPFHGEDVASSAGSCL
jgi:5-methylcytosine-specific restriction enzyme subunit McrC